MDTEDLIEEIKYDFKRTMNKIIFEKKIIKLESPFEIQDIIQYKKQEISKDEEEELRYLVNQRKGLISLDNKRDKCKLSEERNQL